VVEREYEANKSETLRPIYRFLKKFETLNKFLFFVLVITFFFQKPTWCRNRGQTMSKDCNTDELGHTYYVSQLLSLPDFVANSSNFISWFIMFFLLLGDLIVVFFAGNASFKLRVFGMILSLAGDIVFTILNKVFPYLIFKYQLAPFFRIIFMILYNSSMRKSMLRLFYTISGAYEAIFVFLLNLAIWSGLAFILFYGN
jgi:hypothetical protein